MNKLIEVLIRKFLIINIQAILNFFLRPSCPDNLILAHRRNSISREYKLCSPPFHETANQVYSCSTHSFHFFLKRFQERFNAQSPLNTTLRYS